MRKAFCLFGLCAALLIVFSFPSGVFAHESTCKHTHDSGHTICDKHGAKCTINGENGKCKQFTYNCLCVRDESAEKEKAAGEEKPSAETKFGGVPQVVESGEPETKKVECVYVCKAKSSLTGEITVCGWGKSEDCHQAELGARQGCRMTGWKPPYTCGQW